MTMTDVLDAHVHFWDRTRFRYAWLDDVPPELAPDFGPDELRVAAPALSGAVFVQADCRAEQSLAEARWVSGLAAAGAPVRAIVAHAPLEADSRDALIALSGVPGVRGIRRLLQDEGAGFALQPAFVAGVQRLAEFSFSFDLCIRSHQLAEVTELVSRCPDVAFVLDHLGKPVVSAEGLGRWEADLAALAELPNVSCKLSGLLGEAPAELRTAADLAPWIDHALAVFGPDRCMFGSDWPVLDLFGDYAGWLDLMTTATAALPPDDRAAVFAGTAHRVYRIS